MRSFVVFTVVIIFSSIVMAHNFTPPKKVGERASAEQEISALDSRCYSGEELKDELTEADIKEYNRLCAIEYGIYEKIKEKRGNPFLIFNRELSASNRRLMIRLRRHNPMKMNQVFESGQMAAEYAKESGASRARLLGQVVGMAYNVKPEDSVEDLVNRGIQNLTGLATDHLVRSNDSNSVAVSVDLNPETHSLAITLTNADTYRK